MQFWLPCLRNSVMYSGSRERGKVSLLFEDRVKELLHFGEEIIMNRSD